MGQLERYGLYVLCLVIFLILGVAIWGGEPPRTPQNPTKLAADTGTKLKTGDDHLTQIEEFMQRQDADARRKQAAAESAIFRPARPPIGGEGGGEGAAAKPKVDPQPRPADRKLREHRVRKDDNLMALAQRYLGDKNKWRRILAVNPGLKERSLPSGRTIKIPHRDEAVAKGGKRRGKGRRVAAGKTHTVRSGENPWVIAANLVGRARATDYAERMLKLNNISHAGKVREGTVLRLPAQ